jgi:8-oxo-dGTP pyrophosphatase MutT (NUDIX family)
MEQEYPIPTVGILIFNSGKLLLMKSHKFFGKYVVPAGKVEMGEKLIECAIREAKEETGLDVYNLRYNGFQDGIFSPAYYKKMHFVGHDFVADTDSTDVKLNDEGYDHVWVSPEEALEMDLEPFTRFGVLSYLDKEY